MCFTHYRNRVHIGTITKFVAWKEVCAPTNTPSLVVARVKNHWSERMTRWNGHGGLDWLKVNLTRYQPGAAGGEWIGFDTIGKRIPVLIPIEGVGGILREDLYIVSAVENDIGWR